MANPLILAVIAAYGIVLAALFVHGLAFFRLTWLAIRGRARRPPDPVPARWPSVTVQLPIYDERYVAARLIDAVARFEYPGPPIEIQVLDDSTDETVAIVAAAVARARAAGVDVVRLHRTERRGYKAGALADGLALARGERIAILDADFVPEPDFLVRLVPMLEADERLAFVQARWEHANRAASVIARVQAVAIDGHFGVEQQARWSGGDWFNFNGTAGIWRRAAIEDAGGWRSDTLTEDLDLSYRAALRGWRAAFARDVGVVAELPPGIAAYRRQQARWARGSLECAWRLVPAVIRAPISRRRRLWATLHLTGYGIHLLLLATSAIYPLLLLIPRGDRAAVDALGVFGLFSVPALAPSVLFLSAQALLGRSVRAVLPTLPLLSLVGVGMMANTGRVALAAALGRPARFERTPKYGLGASRDRWHHLAYQVRLDRTVIAEIALTGLNLGTVLLAADRGLWAIAFFAGLFAAGLGLVAGLSVSESLRGRWLRRAEAARTMAD